MLTQTALCPLKFKEGGDPWQRYPSGQEMYMKVTVEKEIIMSHVGDDAVLLNIKNGKYFSLNSTGERVWELLREHEDVDKVLTVMLEEYDVDKTVLAQDIQTIVSNLKAAEIVFPA